MSTKGAVPKTSKKNKGFFREKNLEMETDSGASVPSFLPKSKRRNNSVSFIGDGEGTSKKIKDEPATKKHDSRIFRNSKLKKQKKNKQVKDAFEVDMEPSTSSSSGTKKVKPKAQAKAKHQDEEMDTTDYDDGMDSFYEAGKTNPPKKLKKRKRSKKCDDGPVTKIRKDLSSDDELTLELGNLHIGLDPHNLASLLDDMVPTPPKTKKKKERKVQPVKTDVNENVSNEFDLKKVVKWTKKRWNKDKKGAATISSANCSVVVQNLPMAISSIYQMKLAEIFGQFGRIKRIGLPEVAPGKEKSEEFSATIFFASEEAATKALAHDNGLVCGSVVLVRRPPSPSVTTAVARCRANPSADDLRAIFSEAGPLASVRVERRRGCMAVAFLEFDGQESVQRALALSGTVRFKGKPIYVSKFEYRKKSEKA